jgi:DHA2 family multidrug resistance protein
MVMAPGGVATLFTMPFVGAALAKQDGRKIVFCGLLLGAVSMFIMQGLNLEGAFWNYTWPRIVLGFGLAMIFVPLTTVTLASISREEMGNATGLFSLLRNIGGSVGIAVAATLLTRYEQFYQTSLSAHVNPYNPAWQTRFESVKQALIAKGINATQADTSALGMMYGVVRRQAGALAFNRIFFIIGLAFLIIIPLLFLLKRPSHAAEGGMGH